MGTRGNRVAAAVAICTALVTAPPAVAATEVGQSFAPDQACGINATIVQSVSPNDQFVVPAPGVITEWRYQAGALPPTELRLRLARLIPGGGFTVTAQSAAQTSLTPNALNTFATQIPVQGGEVLGLRVLSPGSRECPLRDPIAGYTMLITGMDVQPGSSSTSPGANPNIELDIAAILEPDCDGDDLGDETQDPDTTTCPPAPTATITGQPKDKVKAKKKKVKVTYEFSSNEQGSTFNCVLDGKQEFKTCTSPLRVSVKKGEHTFSVTATDTGGNAGAAATDSFKVKRKKKK